MKKLIIILFFTLFALPEMLLAQTEDNGKRSSQNHTYHRKTRKTTQVSGADSLTKGTGAILNDNGAVNSTGTIQGSRSSTGRPDADSTVSYTVKRKRKTIYVEGAGPADTGKKTKKP
ncbi:hypothetical protein DYBT9275_05830 [Dyadobacter sp. CECT 9275]|uniref:Uncharacterized protein n=1 Tax=Dyadobacter helix TaxID=2822344 RepID=A0A916JJQ9_9BACT|nr:hypothetical protein [Dyadobacter sp. CECT 9275]CAG5017711.1 hypothetical protein DYBT9275_05830 [Dyadobacter sp. CECT 9275]